MQKFQLHLATWLLLVATQAGFALNTEDYESYGYSDGHHVTNGSPLGDFKYYEPSGQGIYFATTEVELANTCIGTACITTDVMGPIVNWLSFTRSDRSAFNLISIVLTDCAKNGSQNVTIRGFRGGVQVASQPSVDAWSTSQPATILSGFTSVDSVVVSEPVSTNFLWPFIDNLQWSPAPSVLAVAPSSGSTSGGTTVTLTGTNFTGATAVKFGTASATGVVVNSATSITATSPAGSVGTVDVTVTTAGGTSVTRSTDKFTYVAAPTVTGISPSSGKTSGGTSVTLTGTNFTGATAVKFGNTSATAFTVNSATSITASSPAGTAGAVDVTVTTPGGTSATGSSDAFTYIAPTSATTSAASSVTSTSVVLNGSGTPNGSASIGYFRYSTTNPGTCSDAFGTRSPASSGTDLGSGAASLPFSTSISGLVSGTSYYYCAIVSNSNGLAYGALMSVTIPGVPTGTTTSAATSVTSSSATLNGSSAPNGATGYGYFRFSTTNPTNCDDAFGTRATSSDQDAALGQGTSAVDFSKTVSGLSPATTYYVCALARNVYGTGYGLVTSFTTTAVAPTVSAGGYTLVGPTSATVAGTVNANNASTTDSVQYGTTTSYGTTVVASPATATGLSATPVEATLTGLSPNTTYHYRVKAVNSAGTAWGSDSSFTTPRVPQTIDFGSIAAQTYGNAYLKLSATATSALTVGYTSANSSVVRISNDTAYLLAADTATVTASQSGNNTYAAASPVARRITIAPKALTVSGATANDKVYDGTTAATLTGGTLSGTVNSDDVSLVPGTATFANKDTGTAKPVAVTGSTLSGAKARNYSLVEIAGLSANIAAKNVTVKANALTKTQGTADPVLTYDAPALYAGDSWSGSLTRDPGEAAGEYPILQGTLSAGGNYEITYVGAKLAIRIPDAVAPRIARPVAVSHEPTATIVHPFATRAQGRTSGRLDVGNCDEPGSCLSVDVALPGPSTVRVSIFDNLGTPVISFDRVVSGREWRNLPNSGDGRSILPVSWNLRSSNGEPVSSGVYLWKIAVVADDGQKLETVKALGVK